jgi:Putative restriction endonuclease
MADGFQSTPFPSDVSIKRRSFSVAELDAMFDANILSRDEKIELIEGEIIETNSQMMLHGVLKMRILKSVLLQLADGFDVSNELTVQLGKNALVDPDVLITPKLNAERRYVRSDELLLAIEVADTSLTYDLGVKAMQYARAGIAELWVININGGETLVHREPSSNGYSSIIKVPFSDKLVPLVDPDVTVVIGEFLS